MAPRKKTAAAETQALAVANADTEAGALVPIELPKPEIILADSRKLAAESASKAKMVIESLKIYGAIETADGAGIISQALLAAQGEAKALEGVRMSIVKPLNLFKDAVQAEFNPVKELWASAVGLAKAALAAWADMQAAEQAKREAEAAERFAEGDATAVHELVAASAEPVTLGAGVSTGTRWFAVVTDAKALIKAVLEGKAPANLVEVSDKNLQAYAKATKGTIEVPGVEFKSATTITGRG